MAAMLSTCLVLAFVIGVKADGCSAADKAMCMPEEGCKWLERHGKGKCVMQAKKDGCFELFGSNRDNCTATEGRCLWVERNGTGKCVMPTWPDQDSNDKDRLNHNSKHKDGCYERFGSDKALCTSAEGKCEWLEKDGEGKCVMPAEKDGCFELFGSNENNCTATEGRCLWIERNGVGKCVKPTWPDQDSQDKDRLNHNSKHKDGCYERFGSDKALCASAEGKCEWLEKDGEGKCVMSTENDDCFELFGSNEDNCTAMEGSCLWVKRNGTGMCVTPMQPNHDFESEDGCHERFGPDKAMCMSAEGKCKWLEKDGEGKCVLAVRVQVDKEVGAIETEKSETNVAAAPLQNFEKLMGDLALSIGSSLDSLDVLKTIEQHHSLLEKAIAVSYRYRNVTTLSIDPARRLREAVSTKLHVRFAAEAASDVLESSEASQSNLELNTVLQLTFEKAGLDLHVQSAEISISRPVLVDPSTSSQHSNSDEIIKIGVGLAAFVVMVAFFFTGVCCLWRWRSSRSAVAKASEEPVENNAVKEKPHCDVDDDLASASTGTPSTNGDLSGP